MRCWSMLLLLLQLMGCRPTCTWRSIICRTRCAIGKHSFNHLKQAETSQLTISESLSEFVTRVIVQELVVVDVADSLLHTIFCRSPSSVPWLGSTLTLSEKHILQVFQIVGIQFIQKIFQHLLLWSETSSNTTRFRKGHLSYWQRMKKLIIYETRLIHGPACTHNTPKNNLLVWESLFVTISLDLHHQQNEKKGAWWQNMYK